MIVNHIHKFLTKSLFPIVSAVNFLVPGTEYLIFFKIFLNIFKYIFFKYSNFLSNLELTANKHGSADSDLL